MKFKEPITKLLEDTDPKHSDLNQAFIDHFEEVDNDLRALKSALIIIERLLKEWNLKHIPESVRKAMNRKPRKNYKPRGLKKLEAQMNSGEHIPHIEDPDI